MPTDDFSRDENRAVIAALVADLVCVLAFTTAGRRSHDEGLSITGVIETAWPFLTGVLVGWLVARGWRNPIALMPTGIIVWLCTVAVGMALRKATSTGTALSFVVVATLVTGVLLLGWRAARRAVRRREPRGTRPRRSAS